MRDALFIPHNSVPQWQRHVTNNFFLRHDCQEPRLNSSLRKLYVTVISCNDHVSKYNVSLRHAEWRFHTK